VSSRRTLILVAAVLIGVVAAFGLYQYVQKVEEDAKPNPVTVYVIKTQIPRGTPFETAEASIVEKTIPAEFRPDNFVVNKAELANKVAITDLAANQVLVQNMFVNADVATTSFRDRLTDPKMVAIAVPVDGVRALSGYLQGGDLVNIIVTPGDDETAGTFSQANETGSGIDPLSTPYFKTARYFYQKVRVLAVGESVEPLPGEPVKESDGTATGTTLGGSIVLLVPADVAQRLAAVDPADLYFTLVADDWAPTPLGPIPQDELDGALLPGEDGNRLTPYGPAGS
jgi:Flp pilus assembly protein CpaB